MNASMKHPEENVRPSRCGRVLPVIFLLVSLAGCRMAVRVERDEALQASGEQLAEGKTLYELHCETCHDLYEPADFTYNEWHVAMRKYGPRTEASHQDLHAILRYLIRASENGDPLETAP
ncbi:MAG: hypothetical protein L6Q71_02335 [Planctomycetes bacterium]|nr:hypothetical protein [Planctomycetota bacterium]NUQ34005.1 hypothetical protein [Planctomycetaceae bacterium]